MERGGLVVLALVLVVETVFFGGGGVRGNVVFNVQHKFDRRDNLAALKAHDDQRHRRLLSVIDFHLGGNPLPTDVSLYFTKLSIGTPSKDYYVQVDTGSDILWVNCAGCDKCPMKSSFGRNLTWYDLEASSTGKAITCDDDLCSTMINSPHSDCTNGRACKYSLNYADGSQTVGYYVTDNFRFEQVVEKNKVSALDGKIAFGCSTKQYGELASSIKAMDGIVGFGQADSSMISQLASSGKVKKIFSHCLDGQNGGGIFAVGQVVEPKVKTTPIIPNRPHYNIKLNAIEVGGEVLDIPKYIFDTESRGEAIIDSGTTLAYFPDDIYDLLMAKIIPNANDLNIHTVEGQFQCIYYSGKIEDEFPVVTFHFENSVSLDVFPRDYFFPLRDNEWCVGWQKAVETKDGNQRILLGDMTLSNKLFVYDLEKQTIGWTDYYNCSSSIQVKDEGSGDEYYVDAHHLSNATRTIFTYLVLISQLWIVTTYF